MKRLLLCLFATICLFAPSCVNVAGPIPYGKWENQTVGLILDINPEIPYYFPGQYRSSEEMLDIFVIFEEVCDQFTVYSPDAHNPETGGLTWSDETVYLAGTFEIKNGKLYYTLHKKWQEKTGITGAIILTKTKDYEVPEQNDAGVKKELISCRHGIFTDRSLRLSFLFVTRFHEEPRPPSTRRLHVLVQPPDLLPNSLPRVVCVMTGSSPSV